MILSFVMKWIDLIISILTSAGIVQGFFLVLLIKRAKFKTHANLWLSILMIVLSFSIIHSLYFAPHLTKMFNNPFKITEPGILLITPVLWFYVLSLVNTEFKFRAKHLVNFIPYIGLYLLFIPFIHKIGFDSYKTLLINNSVIAKSAVWMVIIVQFVYYFRKMIVVSKLHHKKIEDEFSNTEGFDIAWIRYFIFIFFIVYVVLIFMFVWFIHQGRVDNFTSIISLVFSLAIFFLGYKGLFQKEFPINQELNKSGNNSEINNEIIETNKIADNVLKYEHLITKIENYIIEEKPYLDCELTLTSLAQKLQISRNQLSEVINSGMNDNFYNLINRYRVECVKNLMINPKFKNYTILAVAFEAGFASKATFNTIFKKFTGLTPSEYRNSLS